MFIPKEPKELAKIFNSTVKSLAASTGYSRQYLHIIMTGTERASERQIDMFIHELENLSQSQYDKAIVQAEIERYKRDEVIENLKKELLQKHKQSQELVR